MSARDRSPENSGPGRPGNGSVAVLRRLDRLLSHIENFTTLVAGVTIFALMLFAVSNIAMRKLFNAPIFGYIDVVEVAMVVFAVFAISYCQRLGGHVRMEIVLKALHGRAMWLFEWASTLVSIAVIAILIPYSWNYFLNAYEIGDSTIDAQLPTWPAKLLVPVALSILLLRLLLQLWGYWRLLRDPAAEPVAVPVVDDLAHMAEREIRDTETDAAKG